MTLPRYNAAITGVGMSKIGRDVNLPAINMTVDAIMSAVDHAGLSIEEIDGLSTQPGFSETPGMAPVPLSDLKNTLGLKLNWFTSVQEGASTMSAIMNPVMAVTTGQASHVLCFRTSIQYSESQKQKSLSLIADNVPAKRWNRWQSWAYPFNAVSPIHYFSMHAMLRMQRFGLTREQLGHWALNCRRNAVLNPTAIFREPMNMSDYLSSRMISDPLCLLDCDAPIDSSVAFVVSRLDAARELKNPPLAIAGMSGALHGKDSWDQFEDLSSMAAKDAGAQLWKNTSLKHSDIDVANIYDGFSIQPLIWLEALGFCGAGEGGEFLQEGERICLEGKLPMNTGGGQLSGGRMHGFGLLRESCLQLWGLGEERQVSGDPEVALTTVGAGSLAGCLILTRD